MTGRFAATSTWPGTSGRSTRTSHRCPTIRTIRSPQNITTSLCVDHREQGMRHVQSPRGRIVHIHRNGFTLIELLVVVTVIVALLAMLAPALDKAVYQAELAVCAANLRTIASAATG